MRKVKVVTAYVPLNVSHLSAAKYHELGAALTRACDGDIKFFDDYPFDKCWLALADDMPPANPDVPADRYPTPKDNVRSNIVQHQRTTWAMQAMAEEPDVDVWVWLDLGVLKQGDWTGRPVTEDNIRAFLNRVRNATATDVIPFPAIWAKGPIDDCGINWRFVGSTHIWPTKYLPAIDRAYKDEITKLIAREQKVPNDLPVWAHVEANHPELPWAPYGANHDNTQFVNYSGRAPETPLCLYAAFHNTDKGPYHSYTPHYYKALKDKRHSVRHLLEIGIGYRSPNPAVNYFWPYGASLRMWEEFFPNAQIWGLDIAPEVMMNVGRIRTALVDQSSAISLSNTLRAIGIPEWDVIIDDGSHILEHQVLTVNMYLPYLKKGGLFIIEDVNVDPNTIGDHLPPGYKWEAFKSKSEPHHAYVMLIRHE
jgi:hypothetical protein